MSPAERGVYEIIKTGLSTNTRQTDDEVLTSAIESGKTLNVSEEKALEIFKKAKMELSH